MANSLAGLLGLVGNACLAGSLQGAIELCICGSLLTIGVFIPGGLHKSKEEQQARVTASKGYTWHTSNCRRDADTICVAL